MESTLSGASTVFAPTRTIQRPVSADPLANLLEEAVLASGRPEEAARDASRVPEHPRVDPGISPLWADIDLRLELGGTAADTYRAVRESFPGFARGGTQPGLNLVG